MTRLAAFVLLVFAACGGERTAPAAALHAGADEAAGKQLIDRYACVACHRIPGFSGPQGIMGPALDGIGSRPLIAGRIPNDPETMAAFLQNPPAVDPQNRMPSLGLSHEEARHIATYLFTLK